MTPTAKKQSRSCMSASGLLLLLSTIAPETHAFAKFPLPHESAFFTRSGEQMCFFPFRMNKGNLQLKQQGLSSSLHSASPTKTDPPTTLEKEFEKLSIDELKSRLLNILPRMTGKPEENEIVSTLVNTLEAKYEPVLTLDFFNMAMMGEWQLLFSTNMLGVPSASLRLRELSQKVEPSSMSGLNGTVTNFALWDAAPDGINFDTSGTMSIKNSYTIQANGAARMQMKLEGHHMGLAKGSRLPSQEEFPPLFGKIQNAMPSELFDPDGLGIDTTYVDANLRIVRHTANFEEEDGVLIREESESDEEFKERKRLLKLEGVRNIFLRKNTLQIRPLN